jgi:peptidylprolyl isomerase
MKKSEKAKGKEREAERKKQTLIYAVAGAALLVIVAIVLFFALNPAVAKEGDTVSVYYVGMLQNGSVFDSNVNKTALTFTIGNHQMITGFENAVIGMAKGQKKTVTIPVDEAYGPYRSELVYVVNRSLFPADSVPQAGMYYSFGNSQTGTTSRVKVLGFNESMVTVDANHMLAGENLTFTIMLAGITPAK